jgi:hypothetical protein
MRFACSLIGLPSLRHFLSFSAIRCPLNASSAIRRRFQRPPLRARALPRQYSEPVQWQTLSVRDELGRTPHGVETELTIIECSFVSIRNPRAHCHPHQQMPASCAQLRWESGQTNYIRPLGVNENPDCHTRGAG